MDFPAPLFDGTYGGNVHESRGLALVKHLPAERYRLLSEQCQDTTLVFGTGTNSRDNAEAVEPKLSTADGTPGFWAALRQDTIRWTRNAALRACPGTTARFITPKTSSQVGPVR